ncbi:putative mitochondrial inner membrane protease subunit Imp2 [Aspergillus saccharolyticus JOP 1030-1]|uniref:Mitochondrial inner membrane protease subunit 2 n=1 Tax=Aspergillus saccharolyticus JOP 1030-1 TaxID=1450539 RepID=A0A319AQK6_9EURO|nr:LexA/Signal peptidase [Aspergillus saccharolyticus JOP 1030-1]PYH48682.1 LexA/Signal peptidase [Aspergillus saccharolyticus JOP 1030-1]
MPPAQSQPPKPKPKPRVIPREHLLHPLQNNPSYLNLPARIQAQQAQQARQAQQAQAAQQAQKSQQQSPKRTTIFSHLRTRYAALPLPFRRSVRALGATLPLLPIGLFFSEHILQVMWVRGPSMTPYLNEDYEQMHTTSDMVLVNMWGGGGFWPWERKRRLERGMVVTFRSPANPRHTAIKRVVGLPGDRITTREPCLKESQVVPFNHVWLEGDAQDPRKSMDSNTYGPVSCSLITGRVLAVLWPKWRWLDWRDWEKGVVEGDVDRRFGEDYRQEVRERVVKEAVQLERPQLS